MRHHLREDAVTGFWMDERHLEAEEAATRHGVDQLRALLLQIRESRANVRDLVGDMVDAGAAPDEEATDRRVLAESGEELHAAGADLDRGGVDALLVDAGSVLEGAAEQPRVRLKRVVEVLDGDTDVMDPACLHPGDAM
jgi:hypothetical protein